jgi:methyl-accepting chemotaxis protein
MVQTINQMTIQIASAAEQQSATADEINRNIETIHHISDQTAEGAEQTVKATNEMSELATRLHGLVGQFKV